VVAEKNIKIVMGKIREKMSKKEKKNKPISEEKLYKILTKLFDSRLPMRILSEDEKARIPKDVLKYIFKLKKEFYVTSEQFEKIMLLFMLLSDIVDTSDYKIYYEIVNFIYFMDNDDLYIHEILETMLSGIYGRSYHEEIN